MQSLFLFLACSCCLSCANLHANILVVDQDCELPDDPRELYIDLMKKSVTNMIYGDGCNHFFFDLSSSEYNKNIREAGADWPELAHTMIGMKRLNNIYDCLKKVIDRNIPGDCIETGVWRGGATIFMRAILKAYQITDRKVWVADSFDGLPPPNAIKYPADLGFDLYLCRELAVPLETVQANFDKYGLLDKQVVFLKGWFSETLPIAPIEKLAIMRMDGDLYESTMDTLVNLYPKLSMGGFVIVDDFLIPACAQAVKDYRQLHDIDDPIIQIDWSGVYWEKSK